MKIKAKKRVFLTIALVISIFFALIITEGALRVIGFQFQLFPSGVQFGPDTVMLNKLFEVDRELLWVSKYYPGKIEPWQDKQPSIVFMGDSCTQFGRYDKFLKSAINDKHPESDFSFVNVGVGGWTSYQGLRQLKRDVLPMRPRVITIYFGWNDHWSTFGIKDEDLGDFNKEQPALFFLLSESKVVQLVNRAIFSVKRPKQSEIGDNRQPERVPLPDFTSNLTKMVTTARDNGITPVLLTAPSSHRKGEEPAYLEGQWIFDLNDLLPLHKQYVQAVRDVALKENVLLVDLYSEFQKLPQDEWSTYFKKDGIHLTKEGNRKIAELLYASFAANGLTEIMLK